jgi:hypothetical protein
MADPFPPSPAPSRGGGPTPLLIGPAELAALAALRERAAERPVDMPRLMAVIETPEGKARHMAQMTEQSVDLPLGFGVTFSIETGHPIGTCRHMSMSTRAPGRLPTPEAAMMVGHFLGFVGGLDACCGVWVETLEGHGRAVNIVQPLSMAAPPARAQ